MCEGRPYHGVTRTMRSGFVGVLGSVRLGVGGCSPFLCPVLGQTPGGTVSAIRLWRVSKRSVGQHPGLGRSLDIKKVPCAVPKQLPRP